MDTLLERREKNCFFFFKLYVQAQLVEMWMFVGMSCCSPMGTILGFYFFLKGLILFKINVSLSLPQGMNKGLCRYFDLYLAPFFFNLGIPAVNIIFI